MSRHRFEATPNERRVCRTLGQHRSTQRKIPRGRDDEERLTADIIELARQYGRYGYRRRAESVVQSNEARLKELSRRLAELDTLIELRSGEGVEEDLAEATERLAWAREQLNQLTFERAMLSLLRAELDSARTAAREHYFEPVTRELRPLLRILWHDAELSFDDETVLPMALTRNGQEESIDVLSGGTREQIALLVRLAFARLLARSGRPAPIILDDALVYTDDDRIERMFDALHREAGDLQILVLSCRQRAFRALGGTALNFVPGALPEEATA